MKVFIIDPYTLNIHVFIQKIYSLRTFQHDLCGYVLEYVYIFSFRCRSFEYRTDLQKKKRTHTHAHVCWVHQGSVSLQIDFFSALSEIKSQRI